MENRQLVHIEGPLPSLPPITQPQGSFCPSPACFDNIKGIKGNDLIMSSARFSSRNIVLSFIFLNL